MNASGGTVGDGRVEGSTGGGSSKSLSSNNVTENRNVKSAIGGKDNASGSGSNRSIISANSTESGVSSVAHNINSSNNSSNKHTNEDRTEDMDYTDSVSKNSKIKNIIKN